MDSVQKKRNHTGVVSFGAWQALMACHASGGPIFSLRERKDWGEKSAFGVRACTALRFRRQIRLMVSASTGLPYNIALRVALQLELGLIAAAF